MQQTLAGAVVADPPACGGWIGYSCSMQSSPLDSPLSLTQVLMCGAAIVTLAMVIRHGKLGHFKASYKACKMV